MPSDDDYGAPDERQDGFWPSLDPDDAGYIGNKPKSTLVRHMAHAEQVMQAWKDDEWFYCGVAVTVEREGVQLTGQYDHALWGIACNYPERNKRRRPNDYLCKSRRNISRRHWTRPMPRLRRCARWHDTFD